MNTEEPTAAHYECVSRMTVGPNGLGWDIDFYAGTHIEAAFKVAWAMHLNNRQRITFVFNDIPITIG